MPTNTKCFTLLCSIAALILSAPLGRSQGLDLGTEAAQMPDPNGAKIAIQVSADGSYRWKLDGVDQGSITAASGSKQVITSAGRHEIVAKATDGRSSFDRIFTVTPAKPTVIRIVGKSMLPTRTPTATPTPLPKPSTPSPITPTPEHPTTRPPLPAAPPSILNNPDRFVRVRLNVSNRPMHKTTYDRQPAAAPDDSGWRVMASVTSLGEQYDSKIQIVMKDIGDTQSSVELPDPQPGPIPGIYMTKADALGKEAIVCYTARQASQQQAQRWTGTFTAQPGYQGQISFVPAHEPTLEPASDAPCGGLASITKAAPLPPQPEGPSPHEAATNHLNAVVALGKGSRLYNARRYQEARPLLIEACEDGNSSDACNSVGFMYQNHMGVPTDYAKAKEYYLKACNDDSAFSCSNLGTLYRDGFGVPRDYHQAETLFERGCDAGVSQGCELAGKMFLEATGFPQDGPRALDFFKRACDANLAAGCGDEGYIYAKGLGVARDMPFAASLFKRACEMGSPNGCLSIGMVLRNGDGVPRDDAKGREYLTRACDLGQRESCGLAQR